MLIKRFQISALCILSILLPMALWAQPSGPPQGEKKDKDQTEQAGPPGKPMGMPPANVVVDEVTSGAISPMSEFIGTVYFDEVSNVATEIGGIVESIYFEEGEKVKKGQILVSLDSEILKQSLHTKQASFNQTQLDLDKARLDFKRTEKLFKDDNISEQAYDDDRFRVQSQEKKLLLIKAESDEIDVELRKKVVKAPIDGIILEKKTEKGEWLSPGGIVASIANRNNIDIKVFTPQEILPFLHPGTRVSSYVNAREISGHILSIIPKGDLGSRTFPVRIRVEDGDDLAEGMEAKVMLPVEEKKQCLLVPRDAVINKFGMMVSFILVQDQVKMIPVQIIAYEGNYAGIQSMGISPGMKVVVKGNERIQDGQSVIPVPAN